MKTFEFKEGKQNYILLRNNMIFKTYPKSKNSRREAEEKASDVVQYNIKKYGARNVIYCEFVNTSGAAFQNPMQDALSALNKPKL